MEAVMFLMFPNDRLPQREFSFPHESLHHTEAPRGVLPRPPHILSTTPHRAETLAPLETEDSACATPPTERESLATLCDLMREVIVEQRHQTSLLEDLVDHTCRAQRRKETELSNWRRTHPQLAAECRRAATTLSEVQTDYLQTVVDGVNESVGHLDEGEYAVAEFVDRFAVRFTHLNTLVQTLAQLGRQVK